MRAFWALWPAQWSNGLVVCSEIERLLPSSGLLGSIWQRLPGAAQLQQTCSMATTKRARLRKQMTLHERRVANLRYCQERAAWRRQLKELRKQWLQEHLDKVSARKAQMQLARQQIAQLRELRDANKQQDRERHKLEREIRAAERAVEVATMRANSAYRQELRQETIRNYQEQRHAELLEASRSWITPEALQARITAALDNPATL
eukprot:GHRR01005407.1.p2 GENE.GHRR01005407.1~~GHRR01005407.1.p2  ORF type:complete len:205 (+),score=54.82 GHRR01005407.1:234-848(+)